MKCVIDPNLSKKAAFPTAVRTCEQLLANGAEICMEQSLAGTFRSTVPELQFLPDDALYAGADFAIAIGGDGTILRCAEKIMAHTFKHQTAPVPLVGINTGTLGFLAAFEADELDMLDRLSSGDYTISERMLLKTAIQTESGFTAPLHALNDIYASRANGRICDFAVSADGREIGFYRADGIIFSTPTGSSAYALSAGGPVMEPDLSLIEMNLICPHSLFARPMLFAPRREICVTYRGVGGGGLSVFVDGAKTTVLHNMQSFTVTCSEHVMPFVDCKGHAFYDALNGKLMQPLKRTE